MGIKGLKQYLRNKFPSCLHPTHLYHYWGKKAAMDLLTYLYRYKASHGDKWREGLFALFTVFIKHNVHLTVIMDGPNVYKEKDKERAKRKQSQNKIKDKLNAIMTDFSDYEKNGTITPLLESIGGESTHKNLLLSMATPIIDVDQIKEHITKLKNQMVVITKEDIASVKEMCESLSIPFVFARQEAESFASYLCKVGQVDVVISQDTDVLAYGCPHWISDIEFNGSCIYVNSEEMLKIMNITRDQFIDFCILCGCDYNETIAKLGPVTAYKLLLDNKTIEKVILAFKGSDMTEDEQNDVLPTLLRQVFNTPCENAILTSSMDEVPYTLTILYNSFPDEDKIPYPFASSFRHWLKGYASRIHIDE